MEYTMGYNGDAEGEGYKQNAEASGQGGGMGYSMAGPGMESSKGQKAPEANTKGKFVVNKD